MYYGLNGSGWQDIGGSEDELRGFAEEGPDVSIQAAQDDGSLRECPECGAYIEDDAAATTTEDEDGDEVTRVEGHDDDCADPSWKAPESIGMHFNGAGVNVREDHDDVEVWISCGDPRGAFVMRLEIVKLDDGSIERRLSVPTPTDGWLHMPLTPLASPGYYKIG